MLVDTHAHLFWDSYKDDFQEVLQKCLDAGVNQIVNVGVDTEKSQKAFDLTGKQFNNLTMYSTIGIHPHEAFKYEDDKNLALDINALEALFHLNPKKVIGVGECGLDFLFQSNPDWVPKNLTTEEFKTLQRKLFKSQIDLAKKLDIPLTIHCRDDRTKNPENIECWLETLELVKDYKGILHCYSGTMEITKAIPKNFLVSFAGNLTYPKNEYLREAVKFLPLEKILLETDCPFLSPQSSRGKRNDPSTVREIAQLIADLKGESFEKVAGQTTSNFKTLFAIK